MCKNCKSSFCSGCFGVGASSDGNGTERQNNDNSRVLSDEEMERLRSIARHSVENPDSVWGRLNFNRIKK